MRGLVQPRFLSERQALELTEEAGGDRFRTGGEIREWIESAHGVSDTPRSVYSLLARLGCSPRVSPELHEEADLRVKESWKKRGPWRGPPRCGSEVGDGAGLCRRDASGGLRGTAQAGVDYMAASGTLSFQASLNDAHDEGEETLTSSNASGGTWPTVRQRERSRTRT